MVVDVHTHILPPESLDKLMSWGSRRFEVTADATGRTILKYKRARFLGVTVEMASTADRLRAVASIQELDVPRADQQKILGETARQIFRL